jgi:hypothetical protein
MATVAREPAAGKPTPVGTFADPGAERAVLGCYLVGGADGPPPVVELDPAWFSRDDHHSICVAMQRLASSGGPIDQIAVSDALRRQGHGSLGSLICECVMEARECSYPGPAHYVGIIRRCAERRALDAQLGQWHRRAGTPTEDLAALRAEMQTALDTTATTTDAPRFRFLTAEEMRRRPRRPPLVEGLLPLGTLAVISGEPGVGKSFLALDLGLHVAHGIPWHGRAVHPGPVIYIVAEGAEGFMGRLDAWAAYHAQPTLSPNFRCLPEPVDVLEVRAVDDLIADIRQQLPDGRSPVMIVGDTLAACLLGAEENSSEAMGAIIRMATELRRAFGCTVVWLHHPSAAGKPLRGHTSLSGAADTVIELAKSDHDPRNGTWLVTARCAKQKDAREFDPCTLRLQPFAADDGTPCSCVLVPTAVRPRLKDKEAEALQALATFAATGARRSEWQLRSGLKGGTFNRALDDLIRAGSATQEAGRYTITAAGQALLDRGRA